MTLQQPTSATPHPAGNDFPRPVSLETLAVVEQAIAEALRGVRERIAAAPARDAGAIEYDSWLRGARH